MQNNPPHQQLSIFAFKIVKCAEIRQFYEIIDVFLSCIFHDFLKGKITLAGALLKYLSITTIFTDFSLIKLIDKTDFFKKTIFET